MKIFTVDAFTKEPFKGNPAGVCVLDRALSDESYLKIAAEINYAETSFLVEEQDGYSLRWFTPTMEVPICGHATLSAAMVLFEKFAYPSTSINFYTKSGKLVVSKKEDILEMDFPIKTMTPASIDPQLLRLFTSKVNYYGEDGDWSLVELESEKELEEFVPDFTLLKSLKQKVLSITAKSTEPPYDFKSRLFAPQMGIDEDPVTGSAHCYLGKYWSEKLGKNILTGRQVSKRTGVVVCEPKGERMLLRGNAVIMAELKMDWDLK